MRDVTYETVHNSPSITVSLQGYPSISGREALTVSTHTLRAAGLFPASQSSRCFFPLALHRQNDTYGEAVSGALCLFEKQQEYRWQLF